LRHPWRKKQTNERFSCYGKAGIVMELLFIIFSINASLLILHEIESGYEKEWEILNLPGKITGFIIFHIPILLVMFYGIYEIIKGTMIGNILGIIVGIGGLIPLLVHKIIVKRKDKFNSAISSILIYANAITGILCVIMAIINMNKD
jgi:hypothetical protein